jgi:arylsulfatase A-like enzyme
MPESISSIISPQKLQVGVAALVLFLGFCRSQWAAAPEGVSRPNIVLIMADDLGYGDLGCYGQKLITTPRIDELAREGVRFTDFHCGAPVCAPSRCVLMTGKHLGHAAIRNNRQLTKQRFPELRQKYGWGEFSGNEPLPAEEVTVAELLKAHGYATGAIGKWGLGNCGTTGDPNRHGFDLFYGFPEQTQPHNHYPAYLWRNDKKEPLPGNDGKSATGQTYAQDRVTEEALKFLKEHKGEPFFLYLPFTIPHLSIQVPDTSLAQYKGKIPEAPYKHTTPGYFEHPTPRAAYAAMITHMDTAIGNVLDELRSLGIEKNTLVLFTSDNGPPWERLGGTDSDFFKSAGPLRGRKGSAFEGGIREPFIAYWSGRIAGGRESNYIGGFQDILPTLCDLAHIEKPTNIDGVSILPTLLADDKQPQHKYLYWEFSSGGQQSVRAGKWKIIRSGVDTGDPPFELYDLSRDIGEQHNVAAEHPDVVAQLAQYAKEAHAPSKLFPLLANERPGNHRKKTKSAAAE